MGNTQNKHLLSEPNFTTNPISDCTLEKSNICDIASDKVKESFDVVVKFDTDKLRLCKNGEPDKQLFEYLGYNWAIELYPYKYKSTGNKEKCSLYLSTQEEYNIIVNFKIQMFCCEKEIARYEMSVPTDKIFKGYGFENLSDRDKLRIDDPNSIITCGINITVYEKKPKNIVRTELLKTILNNMQNDTKNHDVSFVCNDNITVTANKAMLSAHSKEFSEMIFTSPKENTDIQKINVNISSKVCLAIINFIYTDKLGSDLTFYEILDVFSAAKTYKIDNLEKYCESRLLTTVNESNEVEILSFCYQNKLTNLTKVVLDHIKGKK